MAALKEAVNAVVQTPAMRARPQDLASIVPPAKTLAEVDANYAAQRDRWVHVVRGTGVRVEG